MVLVACLHGVLNALRERSGSGAVDELLAAFNELLPEVHAEAGCIAYVPTVDAVTGIDRQAPVDPDAITIMEQWESLDYLRAHLKAQHMLDFRSRFGHLMDGADLRILVER